MTQYTLAPHWAELTYQVFSDTSKQTFPVSIVSDTIGLTNYDLERRDGSTAYDFDIFASAWATLLRPLYKDTDSTFVQMTLYRQLPSDTDPIPLYVSGIGMSGSGITNTYRASQVSFNFSDQYNHKLRLTCLNTVIQPFSRATYATLPAWAVAIVDEVFATDTVFKTRAGNWVTNFGTRTATYNDKLTKKYYTVR